MTISSCPTARISGTNWNTPTNCSAVPSIPINEPNVLPVLLIKEIAKSIEEFKLDEDENEEKEISEEKQKLNSSFYKEENVKRDSIFELSYKKEYTAHTYSTVQKIKNLNQNKKTKSKLYY